MASIQRDIRIAIDAGSAWDALRDVGRLHERLVKGFVVDCRLEGDIRTVTFGDGMTVRERIVSVDDAARRVVWMVRDAPFEHYNASAQVFAAGDGATRVVWIADLLPDALEPRVAAMIEQGLQAMRRTLEQPA